MSISQNILFYYSHMVVLRVSITTNHLLHFITDSNGRAPDHAHSRHVTSRFGLSASGSG